MAVPRPEHGASDLQVGLFRVHTSKRTSQRYYFDQVTGMSVWHDDMLPEGWGWARGGDLGEDQTRSLSNDIGGDGGLGPRFYVNLFTRTRQCEVPTSPALALPLVDPKTSRGLGAHSSGFNLNLKKRRIGGVEEAERGGTFEDSPPPVEGDANSDSDSESASGVKKLRMPASDWEGGSSCGTALGVATGTTTGTDRDTDAPALRPAEDSPLLALVRQEWLS